MSTPPRWSRLDERELREALAMKDRFMALHRPALEVAVRAVLAAPDCTDYAIENAHDLRKLLAPFDQGEAL